MQPFIFFDVGGTLLHFHPSHAEALGNAARHMGIRVEPEAAAAAVRAARRGHGGHPDPIDLEGNKRWWLGLFGRLLRELGRPEDDPLREEMFARHRAGDWLHPASDTLAALRILADRGHRMAVISNWDDTLEPILERRGLLGFFDFVVTSVHVGAAKPDPRIFEIALQRAGVDATEAVHVGDEFRADVLGARASGIRPVLLATKSAPPDDDLVETILRLDQLPDLLRQRSPDDPSAHPASWRPRES